mmetsp:Transcript_9000/g.24730  ORF Transcript_9000/g.24730 Transcript_9000/m.24730 type:complete len:208 (+) Transcript_9000:763-1386(+)
MRRWEYTCRLEQLDAPQPARVARHGAVLLALQVEVLEELRRRQSPQRGSLRGVQGLRALAQAVLLHPSHDVPKAVPVPSRLALFGLRFPRAPVGVHRRQHGPWPLERRGRQEHAAAYPRVRTDLRVFRDHTGLHAVGLGESAGLHRWWAAARRPRCDRGRLGHRLGHGLLADPQLLGQRLGGQGLLQVPAWHQLGPNRGERGDSHHA